MPKMAVRGCIDLGFLAVVAVGFRVGFGVRADRADLVEQVGAVLRLIYRTSL